jgi:hypothetical protein
MTATIFGKKSGGNKRKRTDESDVEMESGEDFEGEDDEDDEDDAWLDEDDDNEEDNAHSGDVYEVSSMVDLTVPILRDLIADRAVAEAKAPHRTVAEKEKAPDGPVAWSFSLT